MELAQQTANRIAARDTRLRAVGLRVNGDDTVTGEAMQDVYAGRDEIRLTVRFDRFPADRALEELTRQAEQMAENGGLGFVYGFQAGIGQVDVRVRPVDRNLKGIEEAKATAKATLRRFLSPEQRETYDNSHYFDVIGSKGNRYRIRTDMSPSGNVTWRAPGEPYREAGKYCAYPKARLPDGQVMPRDDQFFGQMLLLITDEDAYLDKANLFGGNYPPTHPKHAQYARMYAETGRRDPNGCGCATCRNLPANLRLLDGTVFGTRFGRVRW